MCIFESPMYNVFVPHNMPEVFIFFSKLSIMQTSGMWFWQNMLWPNPGPVSQHG